MACHMHSCAVGITKRKGLADKTPNLIDNREVTVALLANPLEWRVRVVEEIAVDAATTCLRRRSLQVAPLRDQLDRFVNTDASHVLLGLAVAPMPRGPLLDFDVSGPAGTGWLLPRVEIAERQALYLEGLVSPYGSVITPELHSLLTAVCGFTGELLAEAETEVPLKTYLNAGLGRRLPRSVLERWEAIGDQCKAVLRPRLDKFGAYSAPENPALVLPELFADGTLLNDHQASEWLSQYRDLLLAMHTRATGPVLNAAGEFLDALADYANYYDLVVAMKVPLDEPFLVKFTERRDLSLSMFRNQGSQELVIADAQTNHVTFKIPDPNVRILDFRALHPASDAFSYGAFRSRRDPQNRAFYAHDPDRDYRIRLTFRLGLLRRLQLVPYFVASLLLVLSAALGIDAPTDLRTLVLIVGPAALAASVLLGREPSTLGSRLRLVSSLTLAGSLLVLVGVSVSLYVWGHMRDEAPPSKGPDPPTAPSQRPASVQPSEPPDSDKPTNTPNVVPGKP